MRRTLTNSMLLGCTILLAACGDQPTAPAGPRLSTLSPDANVYLNSYSVGAAATEADLTVTSSGGWFALGSNAIYFPANSICDPATSSYGPTEWDAPCAPASAPVHIHARLDQNAEWVAFSPALRFVPANDARNFVYLFVFSKTLRQKGTANNGASNYNLLWFPDAGSVGVDESIADPSLQTHVDPKHGLVYRRVKHFSAYQVVVGLSADADSSPSN